MVIRQQLYHCDRAPLSACAHTELGGGVTVAYLNVLSENSHDVCVLPGFYTFMLRQMKTHITL
jgi:hypothetical protein